MIRDATKADLARLAALGQGDVDSWGLADYKAEWDVAVSKILVAEGPALEDVGGPAVVLGCLVRWAIVDETQVLNIVVHPAARRAGIGLQLMQVVLAEARVLQHRAVLLELRKDNVAARRLYERLGFEGLGMRRGYYAQSGADALLMTHHLGDATQR